MATTYETMAPHYATLVTEVGAPKMYWGKVMVICAALALVLAFPVTMLIPSSTPSSALFAPLTGAPVRPSIVATRVTPNYLRRETAMARFATGSENDKEKKTLADEVDETTKKWGLEAGLWKAWRSGDKSSVEVAKMLFYRYGIAYLATSISLSIVSFGTFWVLVSYGVDVPGLLQRLGLPVSNTATNAGTAAIAYAAHKAASPIRFPPTVALTPKVAQWLGKEPREDEGGDV
jgi:hypothetical protein